MWPFNRRRERTDLARMTYSGVGGSTGHGDGYRFAFGMLGGLLPGTDINWWQEVKDPTANATVHGCLRWIVDNIQEPELKVYTRGRDREPQETDQHPLLELLDEPNPEYDGKALLAACAVDYATVGDAYILKERNNRGQVMGLWWKPFHEVQPCWPSDGSRFITHYLYRPGGRGVGVQYAPEDVIHIRWGLDSSTEGRVGRHRTYPILREIAAGNEHSTYTAAISKMPVPSFALTPKEGGNGVSPDAIEKIKAWLNQMTSRDNRAKPLVPNQPMDYHRMGLTPEEMALDKARQYPNLMICAAFGIHPAVVFLSTDPKGLDNGGQQEQARKQSYHDCLVPLCKRFGRALTKSLRDDFSLRPRQQWVGFCFQNVEALAEDADGKHTRTREDYKAGLLDRAEARTETGRQARPEDAGVYFAGPEADQAAHELSQEAADADVERQQALQDDGEEDEE
jgi:HK97 family phage portal protein